MKKTKQEVIEDIRKAIIQANESGFEVIVAGDSEGNSWNTLNPNYLQTGAFGDTVEKYIALSIWEPVDEEEAFVIPDVPF